LENFPALASQIKLEKSKWSKAKKKKKAFYLTKGYPNSYHLNA
jgi:hypothetical protein